MDQDSGTDPDIQYSSMMPDGTDLIADLEARGLIHDSTDRDALRRQVATGPIGIYYGCDPTADSLHVGNLIGLIVLRRFQDAGHRPIALAGGATGMIGDPGGRSEERNLLDQATLDYNVGRIKEQLGRIVELGAGKGELVDNRDWTEGLSVLDFLRDVGKHVTVNQMLARESIKVRINSEHGISFTEFSYMLLQANDYLWLYDHFGCVIQVGGSDQWGNIISGVDFIRRKRGQQVHAFSWPLLTGSDGAKLGKSTGGRVWLDADKTSPYQFRQHWMQMSDDLVESQLLTFSLRPIDEIRAIVDEHEQAPEKRFAQRSLADELVALVHGPEAAAAASEAADLLFGADPALASENALATIATEVPFSTISISDLDDVIGVFVMTGLAKSKGDARRALEQGGFYVNGVRLDAKDQLSDHKLLHGRYLMLRKGKKSHHLVETIT
jgi:tyrosyl-tRNA synthetase